MTPSAADEIKRILAPSIRDEPYDAAKKALDQTVASIGEALERPTLMVTVEPGHLVNMGQQFNILTEIPTRQFRDVLFRAYIPTDGWPVSLDLFDDDFVLCSDEAALEGAIVDFVRRPEIRQRLLTLKELAPNRE